MKNDFPKRTTLAYLKHVRNYSENQLALKRRKLEVLNDRIRRRELNDKCPTCGSNDPEVYLKPCSGVNRITHAWHYPAQTKGEHIETNGTCSIKAK